MDLNGKACYFGAAKILMENADPSSSDYIKNLENTILVLEDTESPITRKYQERLYQSVIDKAHIDFGDIPKSAGNIRNYSGYTSMNETLNAIKEIATSEKNEEVISYVTIVEDAIRYIADLSSTYQKGFTTKTPYVALEYNTYVYNCVEATTALLYTFIDYVKNPTSQMLELKIKNTKMRADEFYFEQLKKFNNVQRKMGLNYRKMLEGLCNGDRNNFIGSDRLIGIATISAVALAIIPITRAIIYQIYRLRTSLSDSLAMQAKFLEMNEACVRNNDHLDQKRKDKVISKQKNLAKELNKLSDAIRVKSAKSISDSKRDLEADNKYMSMNAIRDDISNSPFEII